MNIQWILIHNLCHHFKIIYFQIFKPIKMSSKSSEVGPTANFGKGSNWLFKGISIIFLGLQLPISEGC